MVARARPGLDSGGVVWPRSRGTSECFRRAPGASIEQARTELTNLGRIAAGDFPHTHQHLRPQLFTFAESVRAINGPGESMTLLTGNIFVMMLLVLVCTNVGLLIFARAATRETEIVVRGARVQSGQATTLTAKDIHARNNFEDPRALTPTTSAVQAQNGTVVHRFPAASVTRLQLMLA